MRQTTDSDEDVTPSAAAESAIKSVSRLIEPQLLEDLYKHISPKTGVHTISLVISGWKKVGDAERFRRDLEKFPGVTAAEKESYVGGILSLQVAINAEARKGLALALEEDDTLKKYGISVVDDTASKIKATRDPDQDINAEAAPKTVAPPKPVSTPAAKPKSAKKPVKKGARL